MNRISKKLLVFAALLLLLGGEVIAQQKLVMGFSVSTQAVSYTHLTLPTIYSV